MNALVFTAPRQTEYRAEPPPSRQDGESLLQVKAAGICGSDMHAWHGDDARRQPPLILGHEVAGLVVEGALAGRRVTVNPMYTCGQCRYCQAQRDNLCTNRTMIGMTRAGGFADYLSVADDCIIPIDDTIDYTTAALTEPTAVCLHAVRLASARQTNLIEQKCLVIGAGAIGILCCLLLRHFGVTNIHLTEINRQRQATAKRANIATVSDPTALPPNHYDCVFDAVGSAQTREDAVRSVAAGGTIIHLGLQTARSELDARRLTLGEIDFIGAFTYTMDEVKQALQLLTHADLGDFGWVQQHAMADGAACFNAIDSGTTEAAKILLMPT